VDVSTLDLFIETGDVAHTREMFTVALKELFRERRIENVSLFFYNRVPHNLGSKYRRIQRSIPDEVLNSGIKSLPL
jgi:hypothetical protein